MPDVDPYHPVTDVAVESDLPTAPSPLRLAIRSVMFIVFPILFGLAGFAGYIALAIMLEHQQANNDPMISYGQQAFLISLPLCTMIAASTGGAIAVAFVGKRGLSVALLFVISLMGWLITWSLRNRQIAQYGRDPSEAVLYYPPAGYAAAAACLGVFLALCTIVRRAKSGEPRVATEAAS